MGTSPTPSSPPAATDWHEAHAANRLAPTLSTADIRAVLTGAGDLLDVPNSDALPAAALALVERLVPCDTVSYNDIDLTLGRVTIHTTGPVPDTESVRVFAAHAAENPLIAHQHRTGDPSAVRLSDFITARQFHRRPIYNLLYRHLGVEFQIAFGVGADPGQVAGIALNRRHRDFSDRDAEVLGLLRPLLAEVRATVAVGRSRAGIADRLTPRQRDVTALVARGATNAQIAGRLQISEKTVAKHLEHVYETLGVGNRTAAAALWLSAHT
jgi:DNA-binding CsgD family transcriptional regulator